MRKALNAAALQSSRPKDFAGRGVTS
jgi:hypothetical protein